MNNRTESSGSASNNVAVPARLRRRFSDESLATLVNANSNLHRTISSSSIETSAERYFGNIATQYGDCKKMFYLTSSTSKGLAVVAYIDDTDESKNDKRPIHLLSQINPSKISVFKKKNTPVLTFQKTANGQKFDYCKVYERTVKPNIIESRLEFALDPLDPSQKLITHMAKKNFRVTTDAIHKGTRVQFINGKDAINMSIVGNDLAVTLVDGIDSSRVSSRTGRAAGQPLQLRPFATLKHNVASSASPKVPKSAIKATFEIPQSMGGQSSDEDSLALICMFLVVREQQLRERTNEGSPMVSSSSMIYGMGTTGRQF